MQGTSAEQDNRFLNKQKKLLKQMKFDDALNEKVILQTKFVSKNSLYAASVYCS